VLVTGADGFVGQHLVRGLLARDHEVVAACHPHSHIPAEWAGVVHVVPLELGNDESVGTAVNSELDAIVHLAAVAYSRDAIARPAETWNVNACGTARLLAAAAERRRTGSPGPTFLVTSSAEVYGEGGSRPRIETDTLRPHSVYGASKLGAEAAAAHAIAAWGLRVIVVRPFPATGPGQTNRLVPNWLKELRAGKREIEGDPTIVRDFTDVRDTAAGYVALLNGGHPGETYNIATGRELRFGQLFDRLLAAAGINARLVSPTNPRRESPYLVGDSGKLQQHTGWRPTIPLDRTLADLIDAQAN
jgi:GDP-4-dehydro-6-deoxy-D-mannose reductase